MCDRCAADSGLTDNSIGICHLEPYVLIYKIVLLVKNPNNNRFDRFAGKVFAER